MPRIHNLGMFIYPFLFWWVYPTYRLCCQYWALQFFGKALTTAIGTQLNRTLCSSSLFIADVSTIIKYYICRWSGSGHRWPAESNRGMSSTGCWGAAADQCANCHDGLRTNINMAGMCSCGQWTREPILDEGAKKLADPKFIYCTVSANISLSVCGRKRGLDWRTRGLETGPVQSIHSEKLDNKNSHCAHGNVEDTWTTTTMEGMSGRSSSFYYCDHCRRAGVAGAGAVEVLLLCWRKRNVIRTKYVQLNVQTHKRSSRRRRHLSQE